MLSRRLVAICVAGLLLALAVQIGLHVRNISPTFDEPYHIVRSYVYLKTGDSALLARGGHPPFANLLSVAPLLLRSDIVLPAHEPGWPDVRAFKDLFRVADDFLWKLGNDAESILLWSRLPVLLLSLALAGLVFVWARQRNGARAGLLALTLYAFDPNLIAHSSVVTTDLGATFFVFVSVYCLWQFCRRPTWGRLVLTGVVFGLAQATKFSCLFLAPIFLVLLTWWVLDTRGSLPLFALPGQSRLRPLWLRRAYLVLGLCLLILVLGFVVLWAVYGFQSRPLLPHEASHPLLDRWIPGQNAALRRVAYALAENVPIPAPAYFSDLAWLQNYSRAGHPSFLLGQYARSGWWYYFLVAFAIKTPIPTLILLFVAVFLSLRRRDAARDERFLLVPMVLFFAASTFSSIDIGYRNILPVLPFLFVYVSKVAGSARSRVAQAALALLCAWLVIGTLAVSPHYLAYFNESVGGPENGFKYLADSNLDWGQDLKNLKHYLDARGIQQVYLSYFGTADPAYYGIRYLDVPASPPPADAAPAYYAVSATSLQGVYAPSGSSIDWIAHYQPVDKVGYSIFIYRLP
jgi:4-amino-4-deoxy-L-arabinose transferase-like glycosyltransferase